MLECEPHSYFVCKKNGNDFILFIQYYHMSIINMILSVCLFKHGALLLTLNNIVNGHTWTRVVILQRLIYSNSEQGQCNILCHTIGQLTQEAKQRKSLIFPSADWSLRKSEQ